MLNREVRLCPSPSLQVAMQISEQAIQTPATEAPPAQWDSTPGK